MYQYFYELSMVLSNEKIKQKNRTRLAHRQRQAGIRSKSSYR